MAQEHDENPQENQRFVISYAHIYIHGLNILFSDYGFIYGLGGSFWIDVEEGMAYVTGQGDPNKLLKLMASGRGKDAEMAFVKTGIHHHSNFGNNYQNSYCGQTTPYWPVGMNLSYHPSSSYGYYPSGLPAMQPYQHQYPYQAGCGYSYY